jgi:diguanylate cyclase (GGDEF)-like protein
MTTVPAPPSPGPSTHKAVALYVAGVVAVALVALVTATLSIDRSQPLGRRPVLFVVLFLLVFLAEARPLRWPTMSDGAEVAASAVFVIGLLLTAPVASVVIAVVIAVGVAELAQRKRPQAVAFNIATSCIGVSSAAAIAQAVGGREELWSAKGPGVRWIVGAVVAGFACLVVTYLLTFVAVALSQRVSVVAVLRDAPNIAVAMDLLLFLIAPLFTFVAVRGPALLPLSLLIVLGVYKSAQVGVGHRHEATHDLLTGLPNRRLFLEQAALAITASERRGRHVAVLLFDLNDFKEINDRLGHAVGDLALREVAARLAATRRSGDLVSRIGGDEFAVLVNGPVDVDAAEAMAAMMLAELRRPLDVSGVPLAVGASVGLSIYPEHGEDVDTLLAQADAAMYQAKLAKGGLQTYDDARDRYGPTRLGLLGELRAALDRGELYLVYQPKIDLRSGEVSGVEALLRWQHPQRGVLLPDHFMPAAEQTELMDDVTEHVLRLAVGQAASWRDRGIDVPVAVNTSIRNLAQLKFPEVVRGVLAMHDLPAERLELEITENTVTNDPVRAEVVLGKLKQLGVRLSVDDFGTGYSSLAHLRTLPIDRIKIDRTFVHGLVGNHGDRVIVRCIIDLANNLGLGTVAEGVEDVATLELLQTMGCQAAQGYQLARPCSAEGVEELVAIRGARWAPRLAEL